MRIRRTLWPFRPPAALTMSTQASRTFGTSPNVDARTPEYCPMSAIVTCEPEFPRSPLAPELVTLELLHPATTADAAATATALVQNIRDLILAAPSAAASHKQISRLSDAQAESATVRRNCPGCSESPSGSERSAAPRGETW